TKSAGRVGYRKLKASTRDSVPDSKRRMLPRWRRIIIRAINTLVPVSIGEEVNSQNTMGADAAATIELRETTRVARMTRTKIGIKTSVAQGDSPKKTPRAVATPFPP